MHLVPVLWALAVVLPTALGAAAVVATVGFIQLSRRRPDMVARRNAR